MEAKGNVFQKASQFTSEVKEEAKKVTWPTARETRLTTTFVFVFAVIAAIYFLIVDQVIYRLLHLVIGS